MNSKTSRKLGTIEKMALIRHDYANGTSSCSAMLKIRQDIDFETFKAAWHIQFDRHPMLRATIRKTDADYYFDFNAKFSNIPCKNLITNNFFDIENEFSRRINSHFDTKNYLWRTTLVNMPNKKCSYLVIGISHVISDGRSISWLLGDLLRLIKELKQGATPNRTSYEMTPAIDDLLPANYFNEDYKLAKPLRKPLLFETDVTSNEIIPKNIFRKINAEQFIKFYDACHANKVTINSALFAAMAQSLAKLQNDNEKDVCLNFAFSLRSFAKPQIPNRTCAFYANMTAFIQRVWENSFWEIAKEAQEKGLLALKNFKLMKADKHESFCHYADLVNSCLQKKEFFAQSTLTNVGKIDEAFFGCEEFGLEDLYFTILNKGVTQIIVIAVTLDNKLYLNFNYPSPVTSEQTINKFVDTFMQCLSKQF